MLPLRSFSRAFRGPAPLSPVLPRACAALSSDALARALVAGETLSPRDAALFAAQTPARAARMRAVVEARTDHVTLLLDNVRAVHNLAAVARSCDAWGVAELHCVLGASPPNAGGDNGRFIQRGGTLAELFEAEGTKRVSKGTQRWVGMTEYASGGEAVAALRARGYRIACSALDPDAVPLGSIDLTEPVAFVFGNEHAGVGEEIQGAADFYFTIPMYGFVESANVSVAAATVAAHVAERARATFGEHFLRDRYFLSPQKQAQLYHSFLAPKTPVPKSLSPQQERSRYDVTRLGSNNERRAAKDGFFLRRDGGADAAATQSFAHFLEKHARFAPDTGGLAARHFSKRMKAGALGDKVYGKRCRSIVEGVSGLTALSCEAGIVRGDHNFAAIVGRHLLAPVVKRLTNEINEDYAKLFDDTGAPSLPMFADETAAEFRKCAAQSHLRAWLNAVHFLSTLGDTLSVSAEELSSILSRTTVVDLALFSAEAMKCDASGVEAWRRAAVAVDVSIVDDLLHFLQAREPRSERQTVDCPSFGVSAGTTVEAALNKRELNSLALCLRFLNLAQCVQRVHQASWEKEIGGGTRLCTSVRFGLLESIVVETTSEMKLMECSAALKESRFLLELMLNVQLLRAASFESSPPISVASHAEPQVLLGSEIAV